MQKYQVANTGLTKAQKSKKLLKRSWRISIMGALIAAAVAAGAMKYAGADAAAQQGGTTYKEVMEKRDDAQIIFKALTPRS